MKDFDDIIFNIGLINRKLNEIAIDLFRSYSQPIVSTSEKALRDKTSAVISLIDDIIFVSRSIKDFSDRALNLQVIYTEKINYSQIKHSREYIYKLAEIMYAKDSTEDLCEIVSTLASFLKKYQKENQPAIAIPNLSLNDIEDLGPGALIQFIFWKLNNDRKLSQEDIRNLQDMKWCAKHFDVKYPILKCVEIEKDDSAQRIVNGVRIYYKTFLNIFGQDYYLLCDVTVKHKKRLFNYYKLKSDLLDLELYLNEILGVEETGEDYLDANSDDKIEVEIDFDEIDCSTFESAEKLLSWLENHKKV